jgi:hypothetical protein
VNMIPSGSRDTTRATAETHAAAGLPWASRSLSMKSVLRALARRRLRTMFRPDSWKVP